MNLVGGGLKHSDHSSYPVPVVCTISAQGGHSQVLLEPFSPWGNGVRQARGVGKGTGKSGTGKGLALAFSTPAPRLSFAPATH